MARKRGMPCAPCCGGTAVCSICASTPTTLYGSWTYTPIDSSCNPLTTVTLNFILTYDITSGSWISPYQTATGLGSVAWGIACGTTLSVKMQMNCFSSGTTAVDVTISRASTLIFQPLTLASISSCTPFFISGSHVDSRQGFMSATVSA
jgi:hypothetical protein